jgi:hypothetical protein
MKLRAAIQLGLVGLVLITPAMPVLADKMP